MTTAEGLYASTVKMVFPALLSAGWLNFGEATFGLSPPRIAFTDEALLDTCLRIALDPICNDGAVEETHKSAIGAGENEEAKHIRAIDIVSAEFEARQCEVQVPLLFVDQIALVMTA
jgi:hypothetical protein